MFIINLIASAIGLFDRFVKAFTVPPSSGGGFYSYRTELSDVMPHPPHTDDPGGNAGAYRKEKKPVAVNSLEQEVSVLAKKCEVIFSQEVKHPNIAVRPGISDFIYVHAGGNEKRVVFVGRRDGEAAQFNHGNWLEIIDVMYAEAIKLRTERHVAEQERLFGEFNLPDRLLIPVPIPADDPDWANQGE